MPGEALEAEKVAFPLGYVGRKAALCLVFLKKKKKRQGIQQCMEQIVGGCRTLKEKEEFGQGKAWDQPKLRKVSMSEVNTKTLSCRH